MLYLSRAQVKESSLMDALASLKIFEAAGGGHMAAHRLVWSLFPGDPRAQRDFLFRREDAADRGGRASFLVLSRRRPTLHSPVFDVNTQDFAPNLSIGDRLVFSLVANPAINRTARAPEGGIRRHDVVMDALKSIEKGDARRAARPQIIELAARAWLLRRAETSGFALAEPKRLHVDQYESIQIGRGSSAAPIRVSVLRFNGLLEVTDPARFLEAIAFGFGRARAFGCGLMLIRRP